MTKVCNKSIQNMANYTKNMQIMRSHNPGTTNSSKEMSEMRTPILSSYDYAKTKGK